MANVDISTLGTPITTALKALTGTYRLPASAVNGVATIEQVEAITITQNQHTDSINAVNGQLWGVVDCADDPSDKTRPDLVPANVPVYWRNTGGKPVPNALPVDIIEAGPGRLTTSATSVTLLHEFNGATILLTNAAPVVTIEPQATREYVDNFACSFISVNEFTVIASTGVTLNGVSAQSYTCEARPGAVTIVRDASNDWSLVGAAVLT